MRVSLKYNGIPTSCEIFSFGQVEDYSVILNTAPANTIVNLKLYIEGFYDASTDAMVPVKANQGVGSSTVDVDAITVELRDPLTFAIAATTTANLQTNGNAMATFTTPISGSYYLVIKHRNAIQTWSSNTVTVGSSPLAYDFTNAITNAFGSNMILVDPGIWAFFSGDINQDEVIDGSDSTDLINNIENLNFGVLPTDLNGDGVVDGSDSTTLINNTEDLIFSQHP